MLNQLIESKNNRVENKRKGGFIMTTLGVLVAVLMSGWTYSLFAKNYGMGGDLELSSLVAPVAVTETAPPPKPEIKIEKSPKSAAEKIVLKDLYEDISKSVDPPKDLRGEKEVVSARQFDLSNVKRGDFNQIPDQIGRSNGVEPTGCGLCTPEADSKPPKNDETKDPELVKPTPKPSEPKVVKQTQISLGVVNGKASYLAKPPYPASARIVRAEGAVNVQVLIDEKGNVVSASAVSGHPLLRAVSEAAARQSRFSPTLLSNQPVKVTGVIVYKFTP